MSSDLEAAALECLADLAINRQNIKKLLRCRESLIPFIGAGLSTDFGFPSWHRLLDDLAEPAGLGPEVQVLLSQYKFEEAAELVCEANPNLFDDTLREAFRVEKLQRPLKVGAVRHLPLIARGIVITTNFDYVLEAAFEDAKRPFCQVFPGTHIREASRAVQLNERCLLKLHGDYRDSESRILTLSEYSREYGNPNPVQVDLDLKLPTILGQALGSRPILFLGCSLKTDRTIGVIRCLAKRLPGVEHFALLSATENKPTRVEQLYEWNIRPLFFPDGQFGEIERLLGVFATFGHSNRPGLPAVKMPHGKSRRSAHNYATSKRRRLARTTVTKAVQSPPRINGYKLFYFRRMRKLGTRALSRLAGVNEREIRKVERVDDQAGPLGIHCFRSCSLTTISKLEMALDCSGKLATGKPDDFLTQYMLFYKVYRKTKNDRTQDEDQLDLFETKAVVFDFDGTLTTRADDETTWEKIWVKLGYSINECAALHHKFSHGYFTHQQWCEITLDKFRKKRFSLQHLNEIANATALIEGVKETIESLRDRGVKLYILSGSIKQIIVRVLGELRTHFEQIQANEMLFDAQGILREIRGTRYDFEGKATFLTRIIDDNGFAPSDVLFVGNSCNDIFASRSGARTLCVNPRATNPDDREHWTYLIRRMDNLGEILKYAQL